DVSNDTFTYYITNRLQPTYVQQFEVWDGGWTPGGQNSSWEFGTPNKASIPAAASGLNAWVTSLTGSYNPSEFSYLESPCFDFSEQDEDPAIEFSLTRAMQEEYDGSWLEMSLDGGQNWEKVGETGEGKNWYTGEISFLGLGDAWSGNSNGWITARHSLPNAAGESEVHLRFVMATSPFFSGGGFGIDDIHIFESFPKDLAGLSISTLGELEECGLANDQIIFTFVNFGSQAQTGFKVGYSINGAAPVVQNVNGSLATDQNLTHIFSVPFDSHDQDFEIKCWTILTGDQEPDNDTLTYTVSHTPKPVPIQENFESYTAPPTDWTYDPTFGFLVTNTHNNISKVLAFNLYSGNPEFTADMPRMGPISQGDSLSFTYRITNFSTQGQTPTILQAGSKIEIQVSTDCGETYQTINSITSFNHSPTVPMRTRKLSLDNFAGQSIKVRFHGIWGAGDFWFDLDNINLISCPSAMDLTAELTPTTPGLSDGTATVNVGIGNPPYQYEWSDNSTEQTAIGLAAGAYTVTVTDAHGCSDVLSINLGSSSTEDLDGFASISLFPNPTSGFATLHATFSRSVDAQIEILNPLGQRVWYISPGATDQLSQSFDLGPFPAGLYLVRVSAEGKAITRKLIKE
ncbi:MAG: T9SS type A sorting domain-containing protein, partial [Saprospiraceae bacterium]|nr:T9SS type A sorting domain-containing protein [Saprospiraceae bacterium]